MIVPVIIFISMIASGGLYYFAGKSKSKPARYTAKSTRSVAPYGLLSSLRCCGNTILNGELITEQIYSEHFKDQDLINKFYYRDDGMSHGYVVLATETSPVKHFICHLRGEKQLVVKIELHEWNPKDRQVYVTHSSVEILKEHIDKFVLNCGHYQAGVRDCRMFSKSVAKFLMQRID